MAATSVTAEYGRLTAAQYKLVARVRNGEGVRYYSAGVHHTVALSLMGRRILACEAATCRFRLLPADQAIPRKVSR